jgi:hypothetical protein
MNVTLNIVWHESLLLIKNVPTVITTIENTIAKGCSNPKNLNSCIFMVAGKFALKAVTIGLIK